MLSTSKVLDFITPISVQAGRILNKSFGKIQYIKDKSTAIDLCTNADIESERFIVDSILKKFPSHSIIAEEGHEKLTNSDYRWIIDPLDGTTNYVHNLPIFSVSIGLQYKQETIFGIVYNPAADKLFYAIKNGGSFLNSEKIKVSSSNTLSDNDKSILIRLIAPFAPHLSEELWERTGNSNSVFSESWPEYVEDMLIDDSMTIAIQVNGKLRGSIEVSTETEKDDILIEAKSVENIQKFTDGMSIIKEIYVPNKLVNLVVK